MTGITNETVEALKAAQASPMSTDETLAKSWQQSTGLVNYDLERPAKRLIPVITPLRNMIPRVKANGGVQANWKAITGININKVSAGVSEGKRGGIIATSVEEYLAAYRGIGLEDEVTFEAGYAAKGFDDVRARAVTGLLQSVMIAEEKIIVGGNSSLALGTTPTPTLTAIGSGGSLASGTVSVICVALTSDGYYRSSVVAGVASQITRNNADGTTDTFGGGSAQKSSAASASVASGGSLFAAVTPVRGAVAYAWYWGAAGSETLGAITTIANYLIIANATGTQLASAMPSSDNSRNTLVFDGLITQISKPGMNAYYKALSNGTSGQGTPLTSDGAAGIVEIDDALAAFWDNYKLSPDIIWVSAQEHKNLNKKIIANGGAPLIRLNMDANGKHTVSAGSTVGEYLNSYGMGGSKMLPIRIHPDVPNGTIVFQSMSLPYPLSGISDPLVMRTRQEYYQIEWPLRTRRYEYGVYADEVLQNYFPPAFGVITNIGNG